MIGLLTPPFAVMLVVFVAWLVVFVREVVLPWRRGRQEQRLRAAGQRDVRARAAAERVAQANARPAGHVEWAPPVAGRRS